MITALTPERIIRSVVSVPPLCRNADFSLNPAENIKLIRHIEAAGVDTLLYGGNANLYHVGAAEYDQLLTLLSAAAAPGTLVIPSVGPTFGTMMDQAPILRRHTFPTAMLLPMQGANTPDGIEAGIRRFVDAAGIPAVLYIRTDGYIAPQRIAKLFADQRLSAVKYAVVRKNTAEDPYLRAICDHVDPKLIVSGLGEQPAIIHMRDFHLGGFTSGVVCVAPHISHAVLKAARAGDWAKADHYRELCRPLEDLRNAGSPIRVLHEAVRLAGIADTGPLLPLLSNIPESEHAHLRSVAQAFLKTQA